MKNNFILEYANIDKNEIESLGFKKHRQMIDFIDEKCFQRRGIVWLIAKKGSSDVFISESHLSIQDFLQKKFTWNCVGIYFLQEYTSFEDAYKVALGMAEISPLCYDRNLS